VDDIEQERQNLIAEIRETFSDVRRENGVSLHEADVIDGQGAAWRRWRARAKDTDKRWFEVPPETIATYYWIFPWLDDKGFRYYIPAYMIWSLDNYLSSSSLTSSFTIYALSPSRGDFSSFLTTEQQRAICHFLRFMMRVGEHSETKEYLEEYWGRFCGNQDVR
jgi:hypothetical protein